MPDESGITGLRILQSFTRGQHWRRKHPDCPIPACTNAWVAWISLLVLLLMGEGLEDEGKGLVSQSVIHLEPTKDIIGRPFQINGLQNYQRIIVLA